MLSPQSMEGGRTVRVDRVEEDIYVFSSDQYAQVTATVLLTRQGAIVIDTLPFPSETRQLADFIEGELGPQSVRYVVITHHHADHVYGAYLFEEAEIVSHDLCREVLDRAGEASLARARRETPALADVEIRLPTLTFERQMHLRVGHRHVRLFHTPGHSADAISAFVLGDKVLIAGDTIMPVPYIARGSVEQMFRVLRDFKALKPDFVVQGHGDVLLRGEVDEVLDRSLRYLGLLTRKVRALVESGAPLQEAQRIDIESCGVSRIPLDGLVSKLHLDNVTALYRQETARRAAASA